MRLPRVQIATGPDQVPRELQDCRSRNEEITAITIVEGELAGCTGDERLGVIFSRLVLEFTTDGARCPGGVRGARPATVTLTNVSYNGRVRRDVTPNCVEDSSVTFGSRDFFTTDARFATLFATQGPQTVLPILDRFMLGWATLPQNTCPPFPTFAGITPGGSSRCPR